MCNVVVLSCQYYEVLLHSEPTSMCNNKITIDSQSCCCIYLDCAPCIEFILLQYILDLYSSYSSPISTDNGKFILGHDRFRLLQLQNLAHNMCVRPFSVLIKSGRLNKNFGNRYRFWKDVSE